MELTTIQQEQVTKLSNLYNPNIPQKIEFKAPTGSGKTLMATALIAELIEQNPTDQFVFVIATPSSSELPLFFEQKINLYKTQLISHFAVNYIKSPSESDSKNKAKDATLKLIPNPNSVYIFGKSSFGKGRILSTRHIIDDFVDAIIDNGYKLIYIRDEAHIGGKVDNSIDAKSFELLMQHNATLTIKMTATPNYADQNTHKVILLEQDINNPNKNNGRYLLKTTPITLLNGEMTDDIMLQDAIAKFVQIKQEYQDLYQQMDILIRPALLIQVDNDSKDTVKSVQFFESLQKIKSALQSAGISWAKYFGDNDKESDRIYKDKFTLASITDSNSDIDAIIFKIGPATGWDIPRACMLLQLRNVCSIGFNLQTIGRIKRNCYPNLVKHPTTDKYYIYSNAPTESDLSVFNAKVKDKFLQEEFMSIEITNTKDVSKKVAEERLKQDINDYLMQNKNKIIQQIKEFMVFENDILCYKRTLQMGNSGSRVTKIINAFLFIREVKIMIAGNPNIFDNCQTLFDKFHKEHYKNELLYSKATHPRNVSITPSFFYLALIIYHFDSLTNLINKNRGYKPKYQVKLSPYIPNVYAELYNSSSHNNEQKIYSPTYLFDTKYKTETDKQPIGINTSSPEVIVFEKLQHIAINKNCIKVWGKNFTTSNVNGAYIDKYNKVHHSFFDYIIKFNNGNFLYIEVKSEQDINPDKTKTLQGAYAEYFQKSTITLFDHPVVICVFKVDSKHKTITQTPFYDKDQFPNLQNLTIDELLDIISQ